MTHTNIQLQQRYPPQKYTKLCCTIIHIVKSILIGCVTRQQHGEKLKDLSNNSFSLGLFQSKNEGELHVCVANITSGDWLCKQAISKRYKTFRNLLHSNSVTSSSLYTSNINSRSLGFKIAHCSKVCTYYIYIFVCVYWI